MSNKNTSADLLRLIAANGDRGTVVPVSCVKDIDDELLALKNGDYHTGHIDWLTENLRPDYSELPFAARCVILVAAHSPLVKLTFTVQGEPFEVSVPPAYCDEKTNQDRIEAYLHAFLDPDGYSFVYADPMPCKLLAVRSGLARYGRNNVTYIDGFGSFYGMWAYYCDMPIEADAVGGAYTWVETSRMPVCESCHICVSACPTGALDAQRKLVNADLCITAMNEKTADFPDDLDIHVHNAIVGCIRCQENCPVNAVNKGFEVHSATFDESETALILAADSLDDLQEPLLTKAADIGPYYRSVIPRNLRVLIEGRQR